MVKASDLFAGARENVEGTFAQFQPNIMEFDFRAAQPTATQGVQFGTGGISALEGAASQQFPTFGQTGGFVTGLRKSLGLRGPEEAAAATAQARRGAALAQVPETEARSLSSLDPRAAGTGAAIRARIGTDLQQQLAGIAADEQQQILQGEQQLLAQSLGLIPDIQRQQQLGIMGGQALAGAEANLGRLELGRGQFLDEFGRTGQLTEFQINQLLPEQQRQALEAERLSSLLQLDLGEPLAVLQQQQAKKDRRSGLVGDIVGGTLGSVGGILSGIAAF